MSRDEGERLRDIKDFRIEIKRVLEIVERDLPPLEETIERLLGE